MLTLSNVSMFARSNSSWYLSILSAFSQSPTVTTAVKSVGVGLSSGCEQLLCTPKTRNWDALLLTQIARHVFRSCCLTELARPWGRQGAWWADPKRRGAGRSLAALPVLPASTEASGSGGQGGSCEVEGADTDLLLPSSPADTGTECTSYARMKREEAPRKGQCVLVRAFGGTLWRF